MKTLKQRIYAGETVHGCWLNLGSTVSAEIAGNAGFDWVLIDLEHGAGDLATMYHQLQVLKSCPVTSLVRTDEAARGTIQRILDSGADGIMFPQLQHIAEVENAVNLMYYPPEGVRGMAKMTRATGFGAHAKEYFEGIENRLIGVIQIETIEATKNVDAIAATKNVDVLFVGPNDLSLALGVFGDYGHSSYRDAIQRVASAAAHHGKIAGVLLQHPDEYDLYRSLGYTFLACGADSGFVAAGAREMARQLNSRRDPR